MFELPQVGICVDAACSGNPGPSQFKVVDLSSGEIVLLSPKFYATNNIAEFLGLVNALHYCLENEEQQLYCDSVTAIAWLTKNNVNSNMVSNKNTLPTWERVFKAIKWVKTLKYDSHNDFFTDTNTNNIVFLSKWLTSEWGEIPADFGNKK